MQNILGGLISSALWALLVDAYDRLAREHLRWYPGGETWPHALSAFLAGGGWHAPALLSALCAAWYTGTYIEDQIPPSDLAYNENAYPDSRTLLARRSLALLASLFVVGLATAFITRTVINWTAGRPLLADPGLGWGMLLFVFLGIGATQAAEWWPQGRRTGDSRNEDGNELPETHPRS